MRRASRLVRWSARVSLVWVGACTGAPDGKDATSDTDAAGRWTAVSAAARAACGIREGRVECWGTLASESAMLKELDGLDVSEVAAGNWHACVLDGLGRPACPGSEDLVRDAVPKERQLVGLSGNWGGYACARDRASSVPLCWGSFSHDGTESPPPPDAPVRQIDTGGALACAILESGAVECWGVDRFVFDGALEEPEGVYTDLAAAYGSVCAAAETGSVTCWPSLDWLSAPPPDFAAARIDAGMWDTCGLDRDGGAVCWGDGVGLLPTGPAFEGEVITDLSVGDDFVCALTSEGAILCEGDNSYGQLDVPP